MPKPVISLIHLGCCKNLVDSEKILGQLASAGYLVTDDPLSSDVVLVNTCGFLASAREEARQTFSQVLRYKKQRKIKAVVALGCMVQLYADELQKEFPALDGCIGFGNYDHVAEQLDAILAHQQKQFKETSTFVPNDDLRLRVTHTHFAYLRITEGCSNWCHYCMIPRIRGEMRSKPLPQLIHEAKLLLQDGARELILIGQDTASYGTDIAGNGDLYDLVNAISQEPDLRWIRIMYVHPTHFQDRFLNLFQLPKVLPYLEMPIQHIHPKILQAMGRGPTDTLIRERIQKLRQAIPHLVLRTTVMVGFPGETDAEFQSLLEFIQETKFQRLGAFMYSKEPGTKAAQLPDDVPPETKQKRFDQIMAAQQEIAFAWAKTMIGRKLEVVIEQPLEKNVWQSRSYGEAPEIDPMILVHKKKAQIGAFIPVEIVENQGYDLIARPL